jgi:hypothetical protein
MLPGISRKRSRLRLLEHEIAGGDPSGSDQGG